MVGGFYDTRVDAISGRFTERTRRHRKTFRPGTDAGRRSTAVDMNTALICCYSRKYIIIGTCPDAKKRRPGQRQPDRNTIVSNTPIYLSFVFK
jgi:hypothetical protein